jgi:hypothetical protein
MFAIFGLGLIEILLLLGMALGGLAVTGLVLFLVNRNKQ